MSEANQQKTMDELIRELEQTREERDFIRAIVDGVEESIELYNREGALVFYNRAFLKHTGLTVEETANFNPADYHEPEYVGTILEVYRENWAGPEGTSNKLHNRVHVKDGQVTRMDFTMINRSSPPLCGHLAIGRVVDEDSKPEGRFHDVDSALSAVFNGVQDAIIVHDSEGRMVRQNKTALEMFQIERLPVPLNVRADHYYGPAEAQESMEEIWKAALAGQRRVCEWKTSNREDCPAMDLEVVFSRISIHDQPFILMTARDVSERKKAEERLRAALREKEVLLREVHHRVKNNLAVIASLLKLQASRMDDQSMADLFSEAVLRVRCIGMVHEKLYQSKSIGTVNAREYLTALLDHLLEVYGNIGRSLRVQRSFEDVSFEPDIALPVGFMTSELFSNVLKHAFPDGRRGDVVVSLNRVSGDESLHRLIVRDNGIGVPGSIDPDKTKSLGLKLVQAFATQLGGEVRVSSNGGTQVQVTFKGTLEH